MPSRTTRMSDGPGPDPAGRRTGREQASAPARLKTRTDFLRVAGGGRIHSRCFSLQVCRRETADGSPSGCRVGLTVTKKVGGAVERNRIKRRLREALRTTGLETRPDHDYVVVARRDALAVDFTALVGELRRSLSEATSGRARKAGHRRKPSPAKPAPPP